MTDHIEHFRARAADYDRIFDDASWRPQLEVIEAALDAAPLRGSCVEFGAGTGWWTARYAARVDDVTLLDASPEMLELARARLGASATYEVTDLSTWVAPRRWDSAVAINFLEHLDDEALPALFGAVDGVVFIAEAARGEGHAHGDAQPRRRSPDEYAALLAEFGFRCDVVNREHVFVVTAVRLYGAKIDFATP